jgi:hypothetical protein
LGAEARSRREEPALVSPARWAYTDRVGVVFDEAGQGSPLPRAEPAIVDGARVMFEAGVVIASAPHPDRFTGFRSLPERLGGGFVLWSSDHVYLAKDFLGEPQAIATGAGVHATGARPWLSSVLLRTPRGLLEMDPRAARPTLRRAGLPGVADAIAVDERRAVRLDLVSRASFTVDATATWTDVLASHGLLVRALREGSSGEVVLEGETTRFALGRGGGLVRVETQGLGADPDDPTPDGFARPSAAWDGSSRALPGELFAHAVAGGALLPGGRVVVAREGGVQVRAARTSLVIDDTDLNGIDASFSRCEAVFAGSPPLALVCFASARGAASVADTGAAVIDLAPSLGRPATEATFPVGGGGFFGGPHGRLAFDGRCGPEHPASDLGAMVAPSPAGEGQAPVEPTAPPTVATLSPDDDARVCVRASVSRWIERRVEGDDARHLYRWVPGDDGEVTALVLAPAAGSSEASKASEGVRVLRVDPDDLALGGGAFPAVAPPHAEALHRAVDVDFWQEEGGAVRGWILLPAEGETLPTAQSRAGASHRLLPVSARRGGRAAGVRISAEGHITVFPLPKEVVEVVTGGRFALAMSRGERSARWFETMDGGVAWTEIAGPPAGAADSARDETEARGCSLVGCAWGSGIVRLGWGGPPPPPASGDALLPDIGPSRPSDGAVTTLACRFAGPPPSARAKGSGDAPIVALLVRASTVGALHDSTWSGQVLPPFFPAAGAQRLSVRDGALHANVGAVVPVLGIGARSRVDALVLVDKRRLRVGAGAASFTAFDVPGPFAVAADAPDGSLAVLDADKGLVWLSRGEATVQALRVPRVADVSRMRMTLAERVAPRRGLALATYSITAGDVLAGDLDLGRAEVGKLAPLGRLDALAEGACADASHRLIIELPVRLRLSGLAAATVVHERVTVAAVVDAGPSGVCVEALEVVIHGQGPGPSVLRAALGKGGSASLWAGAAMVRGACSLDPPARIPPR